MQLELLDKIKSRSNELSSQLIEIRRHLHANPELSFQEFETSKFIQSVLSKHNIAFETGFVKTGIVALIKGNNPNKRCVLLRADMDALPIEEKNDVVYKSRNNGVMHACGHDVHSSCALGAAIILNEIKAEFEGTIKIMFQPGEEVLPGGAYLMINEGVLDNPKVDCALALHVFPSMETGKLGFRHGMYMASTDEIYIDVIGKGGHAAMPAEYNNPLVIASDLILTLNNEFMLNQNNQPAPTVLAFGKIEGKGATNVIPANVSIAGTFRTMDEAWRSKVHSQIVSLAQDCAQKHNANITVRIERGYPFLVNDANVTSKVKISAEQCIGKSNVEELPLRMTAEDFAYISQKVPSCFFRLGTGNKERGIVSGVHTSTFDIDESAIEIGVNAMAWAALGLMEA